MPLYCRITIKGKRAEFSTKRYIEYELRDTNAGKVKGRNDLAKSVNNYLEAVEKRMNNLMIVFIKCLSSNLRIEKLENKESNQLINLQFLYGKLLARVFIEE